MTDHAVSQALRAWVATHRAAGHEPYPAATVDNPERWECQCSPDGMTAVWRILTPKQIQAKFAHLRNRVPPGSTVLDAQTGAIHQEPGKWGT